MTRQWFHPVLACVAVCAACADNPVIEAGDVDGFSEGPPLVTADGKGDELAQDIPAYDPLPRDAQLDQPFEVLFAPDDPVNTVERTLIQQVIDARVADDRDFAEGENPYRIRYAVYNLRNPRVVEDLADAQDAGVDVQVLIESDQLDPERTWNVADERLVERGFELVEDHDALTAEQFATADLIGIDDGGLMHLKTRIFETPSGRRVLSGSLNPGDHAVMNEETLHLINDDALVSRYVAAYEAVLHGESMSNQWDRNAAVNVLFTPARSNRAVEKLFEWIEDEDEQILLMVFSLRDLRAPGHEESLIELLGEKVDAGVPVWVITDRKQSDGVDADGNQVWRDDSTEDRLRGVGVHVYEATNHRSPFTAMHHKVGVLGRTDIRVITDAANWTFSGLGSDTRSSRNVESQLFIDSARLDDNRTGRRYLAQWVRVLSRYAPQSADDGEPSFDDAWSSLVGDGWPTQRVAFTAHEAYTDLGQNVYVRGSVDDLGQWDTRGHQLTTDEASYPTWTSVDPVWLQVGRGFEWKFTVQFPDSGPVRWEDGDNRRGFAQPSVLLPDDGALHEGVWR
jgi:phosphatidylserine/phosphatidylglycerophosphate/cardiolipin synthase-like enzyme